VAPLGQGAGPALVAEIEKAFPRLRASAYTVKSPRTRDYNCIAWAAGAMNQWWWPDPDAANDAVHWPAGIAREETLSAFAAVFAALGYVSCVDEAYEPGYEKVALFADAAGVPTHAARQLPGGRWTSKLGFLEDIEHDLHDLAGEEYGAVVQLFPRPVLPAPAPA